MCRISNAADNVSDFRYLYDQNIIISNPYVIIKVKAIESGNIYYYGAFFKPLLKEVWNILKDYMYAADEYELFNFKESNFNITITEVK